MFERINARFGITSPARKVAVITAGVCTAAALAVAGGSASAAPPTRTPVIAATLSHDRTCLFTATGTWKNITIDQVYGLWYYDDEATARFSTASPGNPLISNWTFGRSRATMQAGPADLAGDQHRWRVLVQFYAGGAHMGEVMTAVDTAMCKMNPPDPV